MFRFAVISDTHMRLPESAAEGGYPSNRVATARNRYVVQCINRLGADFVVHLGDIVHPIPALPSHEEAVRLAGEVFSGFEAPLHILPGNHDLGDKPGALVPAPVVDEANHRVFERHWGPPFRSFDHGDCHFVLLDTPVLNSGLAREAEQRAWLEADLAGNREAGRRLFVFLHYPPFLCEADEPRHYDNIDEPARAWLLGLLGDHAAEAVFAGHVHNFFYNRLDRTDFYVLPSTAFVRPEYAELAAVGPGGEFGRDDEGRLGFFLVDVFADGHAVHPLRTYGRSGESPEEIPEPGGRSRLGVSLRHPWAGSVELPTDGLDEFTRKRARPDGLIEALWELGIAKLRIPSGDLLSAEGRARVAALAARGHEFTVFSAGVPDDGTVECLAGCRDFVAAWEVIAPAERLSETIGRIAGVRDRVGLPVYLAPVVPYLSAETGGPSFQHFASHGFSPADGTIPAAVDGVTFRIAPWESPWERIAEIAGWTETAVAANLQLPRVDEGIAAADDLAAANHVAEAALAAAAFPRVAVFLDTFMDHDRGYYPRHGLVDRRFNPRPAFHALRRIEAVLAGDVRVEKTGDGRRFRLETGSFSGVLVLDRERGPELQA